MEPWREVHVALPPCGGDIYRRHQLVWRAWVALQPCARSGREFLFASVSPSLVRLRSERLQRGAPSMIEEGRMHVDLVAARRDGARMTAIEDDRIEEWVSTLFVSHGLLIERLHSVGPLGSACGAKRDRRTGHTLEIRLPVRAFEMDVTIAHGARANLAWGRGIGRGKRFGFGMLQS